MRRQAAGWMAVLALTGLYASPAVRHLGYFPTRVTLETGRTDALGQSLPAGFAARVAPVGRVRARAFGAHGAHGSGPALVVDGYRMGVRWHRLAPGTPRVRAAEPGAYALEIGALGIPFRTVDVRAVRTPVVVAGGDSIGLRVRTQGVLVAGRGPRLAVRSWFGTSDVREGDRIVRVDGRPVAGIEDLRAEVERAGKLHRVVTLGVVRRGLWTDVRVAPVMDRVSHRYRLGLRVREGLTGIGTLTLLDPRTHLFAALGHRVEDGITGQPLPVAGGEVQATTILGIERGGLGHPGEKVGVLARGPVEGWVLGGGPFGVYGELRQVPQGPLVPIATVDEIHPGPAVMRTVVAGHRVAVFRIRIERVDPRAPGGRGLVLRVTDPRLIARAGGIVQGMSGSPILQDGRLVGAVTHVLVSDSLRGYGTFAIWMWQDATRHLCAPAVNLASCTLGHRPDSTMRAG